MKTHKPGPHALVGMSPLQKLIDDERAIIKQHNIARAKENPLNHKLYSGDHPLALHTDPLETAYHVLYSKAMLQAKPDLNRKYGSAEKNEVDILNNKAQKRINKLEAINDAEIVDSDDAPGLWILVKFTIYFIGFLGMYFGELTLLASAAQTFTSTLSMSYLVASCISASVVLLVTYVPNMINRLSPRIVRIFARIVFVGFLLGIFYAIGNMRSDSVRLLNGSTAVSPLEFAIMNFVAFCGLYLLAYYCMAPLSGQVQSAYRAFMRKMSIASRNREIKALEVSKNNNETQLNLSLKNKLFVIDEADQVPQLLRSMFKEDVAEYKRIYIENLPESAIVPPCFYHPVPDLVFTLPTTEESQL